MRISSEIESPPTRGDGSTRIGIGSAEANHRIANNLNLLASLASLRARNLAEAKREFSPREVADELNEVGSRIATIGMLHKLLSSGEAGKKRNLGRHLKELGGMLVSALSAEDKVRLRTGDDDVLVELDEAQLLPVSLIVAEAVTNSIKYAHPSGISGELRLGCRRCDDGATEIEIADDGVGLPDGFDTDDGGDLGLKTIRLLAEQAEADISFEDTRVGLTVRVRLPAPGFSSH